LLKKGIEYVNEKITAYVEGTGNKVDDFIWNVLKGQGEELAVFADMILDFCEDYVLGTASKIDDALVLPVCNLIRSVANIPDND